jgi:RNA polymerase sigma-70 factor (ECF subfamily)
MTTPTVQRALDAAFREEWGRVVATLVRRTGDWDLAEECAQEAFAEALRRWPVDGVPQRPGAWLTTVAGNRAIDRLRRARRGVELLEQFGRDPTGATHTTMDPHTIDTKSTAGSRTTACA